ncbi:hypothetical protein GO013_11250 [Pseudodesulfovibrio sp. JC047]|uniref:hypothetical protein n=1 Tax=Pseudodesulfovibrio sp. JC047 TaxID=2683199 RepID=UPI0013D01378|nr:hypothetical protein [Pseudodesulfovibrio sp. JC047]NDV19998.1 hypothetical protein [Pseudodesulfovibrio sp. JC047]
MSKYITKTYEINGEVYELMRPVFGVLRDIAFFCREAGESVSNTEDLKVFLKDKTGLFVAHLITPKGIHPMDRDFESIARVVDWEAGPDLSLEVMDDFFGQPGATPEKLLMAGSMTNSVAGMILPSKIAREVQEVGKMPLTPSSDMLPNSQEVTPSSEFESSGNSDMAT